MKFAGLLCVVAGLAHLSSSAAIIDRDDPPPPPKPEYILRHYGDTEPAKNYCKVDGPLDPNFCPTYSNTTVLVDDCIRMIRLFRGNSSRFELGHGGGVTDSLLPAVGFGTCAFSVLPTYNWTFNIS